MPQGHEFMKWNKISELEEGANLFGKGLQKRFTAVCSALNDKWAQSFCQLKTFASCLNSPWLLGTLYSVVDSLMWLMIFIALFVWFKLLKSNWLDSKWNEGPGFSGSLWRWQRETCYRLWLIGPIGTRSIFPEFPEFQALPPLLGSPENSRDEAPSVELFCVLSFQGIWHDKEFWFSRAMFMFIILP